MLTGKNILIIITGGIAAYKSLDLIRKLKDKGALVTPVKCGAHEDAEVGDDVVLPVQYLIRIARSVGIKIQTEKLSR